ncbi:amidohydrolase [Neobacillus pocheonensis]|uniref:amidohydrolase n=1 Tax=Neobacillus pocheonensis TaxID=363869 RepID=UPI003D264D44
MEFLHYIKKNNENILQTYHQLHTLAEPSWEEKNTSHYLAGRLKQAGFIVKTFPNHFGIIAEIPGESDQVIALRADMDALVQEVDSVVKPNHSCGHDAHSTMVLYAALSLASSGMKPKHTLRFIFQPAEEKGEGALQMIKDGALQNVSMLFGIHVRPNVEVPFMKASPVIIHGAAGTIKGTIKGLQAHASRPQDGINAIEAAALLIQKLKEIDLITKTPYSIKMTQLQTENAATNVIPETATFSIDARAQTNETMNELKSMTKKIMEQTMEESGAAINWSMEEFVPAASVHQSAIKIVETAIIDELGKENLIPATVSQGGEDFHFYTVDNPDLAATMVGLGCDLSPGLHHPQMKFNLDALQYGANILIRTILLALEE